MDNITNCKDDKKYRNYLKAYLFSKMIFDKPLNFKDENDRRLFIAAIALYTATFEGKIHRDLCFFYYKLDLFSPTLEQFVEEMRMLSDEELKSFEFYDDSSIFDEKTINYGIYFRDWLNKTCPKNLTFDEWVRTLGQVYAAAVVGGSMYPSTIYKSLKKERRFKKAIELAYQLVAVED